MRLRNRSGRRRNPAMLFAALLVAGLLALPATLTAQTTTSAVRGTVTGESGPVAGATVEALATETNFRRSAVTDAQGRYTLVGLAPGPYDLIVTAEGYQPQARPVTVRVAQDAEVNIALEPGEPFGETVEVTGTVAVETETSEVGTNVSEEQIELLPQNSRNFLNFAGLAPGVSFTDDEDAAGKKFRGTGQDARQVNVFVDGLSYKNDLLQGGAFMQDSSRGNPFPQNAVQEFRVLSSNYKAEYEKASAAVITAVTKSGGNEHHGEAFYLFQDKGLVEQDDFSKERGEEKADYDRDQYGLSIGGPILQDRLFYFGSYEANRQDRNATVFLGPRYEEAPANVRSFIDGFETGVLTSPFESDLFFGKLTWQGDTGQSAYVTAHVRDEQEIRGYGGQRTRDGAESFEIGTDALVGRHTWVLGDGLNEASVTYQELQWHPTALNSTEPRLNYQEILDTGGKDATQNFLQEKIGLRDDFTYLTEWRGTHTFKTGASANFLDYTVTKEIAPNGVFELRRDEDWQFPYTARIGFGDPTLSFSNEQYGVYLQDDWAIRDDLTLNLGVRYDYETNMINNDYVTPPEIVSALSNACRTYDQPVGGQTEWCLPEFLDLDRFTTDGNDRSSYDGMVQPRVGFAWSPFDDAETVIFGGWGLYYDRVVLNDIFDEEYRHQWQVYTFCFSEDGSPTTNCGVPALQWQDSYLSADALRDLIASGRAPGPEIFLVDNELKPPKATQWTLGLRQRLGNWNGSLSYVNVESENGIIYFFADLPPGTDFGNRFGGGVPIEGYARAFYTSQARKTWYDAILLSLDRPISVDGRWGFQLAYTYADAEQNGTDNPGEGIAFGAFDYAGPEDFYRFPASNVEDHRVVASGIVRLPWNLLASSVVTLGSGVPFTIFDSTDGFRVRWNEGEPEGDSFLGFGDWAYRSVDARLEWQAPPIGDVALTLIGEGFNVFDYDNYSCFNNSLPSDNFGEPNCEYNTRRFQVGARVSF